MPREALIKSARAGSERFCPQASFEKWRNTLCISHFSKGSMWAKDPLSSRRRFIQSFPNERKKPSPVNQGKAGRRPHPALRATFPSQGKALVPCNHAPRGKYVLARRPVGPTWLPPLPSGGTSPIGSGKALMGIFLSVSVLVHSISREMSSAYLILNSN